MPKLTKQCYLCKQEFKKEELVDYASENAKIMHSYCPKCLKEKQEKDRFANVVCKIFGIKAPGPRIWTERKRLIETYGYTDNIIINCLEYIYNIEKKKKLAESLCLVKPPMVEKMMQYKREEERKQKIMIAAMKNSTQMKTYVVPVKENNIKKQEWDSDEWLDD